MRHVQTSVKKSQVAATAVVVFALASCSPSASEEPAAGDGGGTTTTGGGSTEPGNFTTGAPSTAVTGASLAALDFTCTATTGIFETLNDILYTGSKLVCTPNLSLSGTVGATTKVSTTYSAMVNDVITVKWTLARYFGDFYLSHTCSIGTSEAPDTLTCLFQERNRAAKTQVELYVEGPSNDAGSSSLALTSISGTKEKEFLFDNDCVGAPTNLSSYDQWGDGTQADPYLWCKPAQMADFKASVSSNSSDMSAYFRLGANLGVVSGSQTIGSAANPFKGVFQGNGYSFELSIDLNAQLASSGNNYLGLFSYLQDATLDYFVVDKLTAFTTSTVDSGTSTSYFGALAGYSKDSTISRITMNDLDTNSINPNSHGLGLSGALIGELNGGSLSDSTIQNFDMNFFTDIRGGVVGKVSGSAVMERISIINIGVVGTQQSGMIPAASGLAVGINEGTMRNINISGESTLVCGHNSGGMIGLNSGSLEKGNIDKIDITSTSFGIVCGVLVGSNTGSITKSSTQTNANISSISGFGVCGGIAGESSGSITDSYSLSSLPEKCASAGTPGGFTLLSGGLVGRITAGTYTRNYVQNTFTGTSFDHGGFAGEVTGSPTFTSNYWNATTANAAGIDTDDNTDLSGVNASTSAELQSSSTFTGWDFTSVWKIQSGSTPTLR